jgi:type IV secretory pathway ATPase VirB11/archaellum biosynthesis ATPase/intein/homing endonuclease
MALSRLFRRRGREKIKVTEVRFKAEPLTATFQGEVLEKYSVDQAVVFIVDQNGRGFYLVSEPELTADEQRIYNLLMEYLYFSLKPVARVEDPMSYVEGFIWDAAEDLGMVGEVQRGFQKYRYFIIRDAFGYGPIQVPMMDPYVEEVSCTGYGRPIMVVHRRHANYDWLETNILFQTEDHLKSFVQRMAQRIGKSLTTAIPFADAMSREGHRIAMTFGDEVTLPGSTFSIRKFPEEPLSMAHLLKFNTLTPLMAAYLWLIEEYRGFIIVLGPMASGKSVSGDESVLAVLNGSPVLTSFDDLWRRVPGEVFEEAGFEYKNPGVAVISLSPTAKCEIVKPRAFIRHPFKGRGVRVVLRDGREVVTTRDHSLMVLSCSGELAVKTPEELREGDMLPVPSRLKIPENPPAALELLQILSGGRRLYVERRMIEGLGGKLDSRRAAAVGLKAPILDQRRIPLEVALRVWVESGSIPDGLSVSDRVGFCSIKIFEAVFNPLFARVLGYYIADGHYDGGKCVISIRNEEMLNDVVEACRKLGFKPYVFRRRVILPSAPSAVVEALGCGWNAGSKSLPSIYWRMPKEWKRELLHAYFRSDGWVEGFGSVHAATKSFTLSRQIMLALLEFGIHATRRVAGGARRYEVVISPYFAEEFAENVGFSESLKELSLKVWRRKLICSRIHTVPNCLLRKHMDEVRELAKSYKLFDRNVLMGYAVSKKCLLNRLKMADPGRRLRGLWSLAESEVTWVPVRRVEEVDLEGYVYDFSTPTETFMAGDGIIVHNTTMLNGLLTLINPDLKICTIEDTSELRIPHKSWQRFKSRRTYSISESKFDVDLMDLVRLSLRYRPDYIVVGEVRGEEIRALFQAASLGHGCSTTFHAEDPNAALARMRSPPMSVAEGNLMLISCFVLLNRVRMVDGRVVRRVLEVTEVEPKDGSIGLRRIFTWDPRADSFKPDRAEEVARQSVRLRAVERLTGWSHEEVARELERRVRFLQGVVDGNKLTYAEFSGEVRKFYISQRRGVA